ncbi:MAG: uracil-DNA glycosylase [Deltaproteobacteria bacterium]|nr:MAG: uracil-DNA glycosylase [Deltaproteobacteria bacterium]
MDETLKRSLKAYLRHLQLLGMEDIPCRGDVPMDPERELQRLAEEVRRCRCCPLHQTRKNPVPGEGNPRALLVFVGEAPGADEDLQGRPFVGRAGELLTRIIKAMGLERQQVYITNILKCRPPQNRNPRPDEIRACIPFLWRQLEIIRPKLICALGTFAAQTLLETREKITRLRGRFHPWRGALLMPTYHPAFLLRNPQYKRDVWEDMKMVMAEYQKLTGQGRR